MNKTGFLSDPDVQMFIDWLETKLDMPGGFDHNYYLIKANKAWSCNCLYEAYEKYWWPFNMTDPSTMKKVSTAGMDESFEFMTKLAQAFRQAVHSNDPVSAGKSATDMLKWGGVLYGNRNRILNMGEGVCDYFKGVEQTLALSTTSLGQHEGIYMNSGFTKLYFLLIDDFIMYDGRVGAALGLLGRIYAQEKNLEKIPEMIEFSYGSGKRAPKTKNTVDRRDPGNETYKFPRFTGNSTRHINDNIKAGWLLKELGDKTRTRFAALPQENPLNKRLTAIQSALFMIGYDVQRT